MRIAVVAPLVTPIREPQLGGSQAVVADLARGLAERGHQVEVYAAAGSVIPGVTVVDTGVRPDELASLLYRADRSSAAESHAGDAAFRTVFDAVNRGRYDVVHNHGFDPPAVRFACTLESHVIHTLHLPPDATMAAALDQASRSANPPTIATVSTTAAAGWRRLTRVDVVLPNGVPVNRISWSETGGGHLLFAGRFSPEKGAAHAIAIAREADVPIDLYGEPYDAEYARDEVDSHRGEPDITIHGGVPRTEIWTLMARACAVLCPARWDEPFGMAAAEAQAAGTPVIAYDRGALGEVVRHGKTGFLVPPDDVAAAAQRVKDVPMISRADCRRHAEAHLNLGAAITAHERLYNQVRSRTRAKSRG
jgi:glycosyltransferase involved in cell wall biosynthesis